MSYPLVRLEEFTPLIRLDWWGFSLGGLDPNSLAIKVFV